MTEPSVAPVEDRLRRTFGARAEDMAPGDADDADPIPPLVLARSDEPGPGRRLRRPTRPVLAAAAVLVVALAAAAVAVVALRDDGGDPSGDLATGGLDTTTDRANDRATADLVIAPRGLIMALEDERNAAVLGLTGLADAVETPVDNDSEARVLTDAQIFKLEELLADNPGGPRYERLLGALADLDQLREEVDAFPGPRDITSAPSAQAIFDRYSEVVTAVLDAHAAFVHEIDDGYLREGGEAYARGLRLQDLTTRLLRTTLLTGIAQQGPHPIEGLNALLAETEGDLDRLEDLTDGTLYEDATTAVADELQTSGLFDEAHRVLGGTMDVVALLAAGDNLDASGWADFLDQVERLLVNERR